MQKIIYKTVALLLCISLLMPALPARAAQSEEIMQSKLYTLTQSLQSILLDKKEEAINEIEREIVKNNWDYDLTMESIESVKIFKDMDYIQILSAYMTAKEYYEERGVKNFTMLKDVPLITYTLEPVTVTEEIPQKIWEYRKLKEGVYVKNKEIYMIESGSIPLYEKKEDGYYDCIGQQQLNLKTKDVTYAKVEFHVMESSELLDYYQIDVEIQEKYYEQRIRKLSVNTGNKQIYQSMFSHAPSKQTPVKSEEESIDYSESTDIRKNLIKIAKTLIGQVPYEWGGKASKPGYDTSWWLFDENSVQKGLDCSGYVQWAYMTAGFKQDICSQLVSTTEILNGNLPEIEKEELKIGDIGVKKGLVTNHTGIYYGNIDGKDMWLHCSSGANTVIVSEYDFQKFYSPISIMEENEVGEVDNPLAKEDKTFLILDKSTNSTNLLDELAILEYYTDTKSYTDEEVYLLAQLIIHEAGAEGINGWVAVAEVIKNRVESDLFPDNIRDVIYQNGQFSHVEKVAAITPGENVIQVARSVLTGQMSILNNSNCLYYRNPQSTSNISVNAKVDWGSYPYYMPIGNHVFYLQK